MEFSHTFRVLLLGALSALAFATFVASSALSAATGGESRFGRFSLVLASFPTLVSEAVSEARDRMSGREDYRHVSVPRSEIDLSDFAPLPSQTDEKVDRLVASIAPAGVARGWRLLAGAFALSEGVSNAAILVDPDFHIRRVWKLDEDAVGAGVAEDSRKIVHGLQTTRSGDLIVVFDHGSSIQRFGHCGGIEWARRGGFHHAVTLSNHGRDLWTLSTGGAQTLDDPALYAPEQEALVRMDPRSGDILQTITVADILLANPGLGLLTMGFHDREPTWSNATSTAGDWEDDPFHFNDIDPLPEEIADAFPDFSAGDLLVSSRSLNSVFVLDPASQRIKWHMTGEINRQHDPDWLADGRISIYDNRTGTGPSRIVAVDPTTRHMDVVLDGEQAAFYSRIRGKHMRTPAGALVISSPQQGRAFEASSDGIVAEFYNLGPIGSGLNLALTEFIFIPEADLDTEDMKCPDQ